MADRPDQPRTVRSTSELAADRNVHPTGSESPWSFRSPVVLCRRHLGTPLMTLLVAENAPETMRNLRPAGAVVYRCDPQLPPGPGWNHWSSVCSIRRPPTLR